MPSNQTVSWSQLTGFHDKQKLATQTADQSRFTLYGGAAGGGKSYWLRWYPIRWLIKKHKETGQKGIVAGLFCEDYPSLKDRHLGKMKVEFPEWLGDLRESSVYGISFQLKPELGGGVLVLRNLDDPSKYFSSEFALIAVDELTKNSKETFDFLRMRLRWPGIADTRFIAGTNPGGLGHNWVKKIWVDRVLPPEEKERDQFAYVRATVDDNPKIDPTYIRALESLPERMRKAYREGDWNIFEGQFFTEFEPSVHVVEPFELPSHWARMRSIDPSGRDGITSCHWYAVDTDGNVYVYREYYGTRRDSDQHADEITRLSTIFDGNNEKMGEEQYRYTVMDAAAFAKMGMPETTSEVFERHGVYGLIPSMKNRPMGWDFVHQYMRWDEKTKPKLKIFSTCPNMIRTLPTLVHDELHPEDLDTAGEDHCADDLRYMIQTLREGKSPSRTKSFVEIRLEQMRAEEEAEQYNFNYKK